MSVYQCRKTASQRLSGCYSEGFFVVMIFLAAFLIYKLLDIAQSAFILYNHNGEPHSLFYSSVPWELLMKAAFSLLAFAALSPLITGGIWWFFQTAGGGDNRSILKLYTGFKLNVKAMRLYSAMWLVGTLSLLPTGVCFTAAYRLFDRAALSEDRPLLLFISLQVFMAGVFLIGLCLKSLSAYILAPFIFINRPETGIVKTMRLSRRIMYGSELEVLKLMGLCLLPMLPLVTVPFVLPKAMMSLSVFACDRMKIWSNAHGNDL